MPGIERAAPLAISTSFDQKSWNHLLEWDGLFGGRLSGAPLCACFSKGVDARYVKVEILRQSYLHLDYIEILQNIPTVVFGAITELRRSLHGLLRCDYLHTLNSGLYSGCTTALQDIITLAANGLVVDRIDLTRSFHYFKDKRDQDVYPIFFKSDQLDEYDVVGSCRAVSFDCKDVHRAYKDLPLAAISRVVTRFFSPSDLVAKAMTDLLQATELDPDNTIAIVYRGTDKGVEVVLAPIERYIEVAQSLKKRCSHLKILIQTDQKQARDQVVEAFGSDCIFFDNLPVTDGATAIHLLPDLHAAKGRVDFTVQLMAAALISSQCKHAILHTGNVGAWIAFYRGRAERLFQFDAGGQLIPPPDWVEADASQPETSPAPETVST